MTGAGDYGTAELLRRIEQMVMVATVTELNAGDGLCRVKWNEDGAVSGWLRVAQLGSNALPVWFPPEAGTQVVVLSPGGDTTKGIVYPGPFMGAPPAGNFAGNITGSGDIVVEGISHVTHVHDGIAPGPADTGEPK